ncbi:hypothetical protein PV375_01190 [Gulosibacter sp. GYB002]|uniref:hypothetical protein n=1 Tax=Gulosibacter sp. GYB002 TaxID=2994391 RepID=UPI002F966EFD
MRDEIRLAERLGVSPRRLWGEPQQYRAVADDDSFQVVMVDEFTSADIDLFLAAKQAEESISPRGIPYEDEMNKDARFHVGGPDGLPRVNHAIRAQQRADRAFRKKYETEDRPLDGLVWPVTLVDGERRNG